MSYLGDFAASSVVNVYFTTNSAAGAAVAPSGAFGTDDIILYKDNSATQRTSAAGWTVTSPFDSLTGLHLLSIDTSDNTDAGFYAAGHDYTVILSPNETVDSQTVIAVIGSFSIQNRPVFVSVGTGTGQINVSGGKAPATIAAGDLANNSLTAAALATDAVTEIVNGIGNTVNTGATFNLNNSVFKQIRQGAGGTITIRTGTCQAGSTSTAIKLDSAASATDNLYQGCKVVITGGTGAGQQRNGIAYSGTTKLLTVDKNWVVTPDGTSAFELDLGTQAITSFEGTATAGGASTVTLPSGASAVNNFYVPGLVTILAGTGAGQTRENTGYVGSTRVLTVDTAWSTPPDNTSVVAVIPSGSTTSDNAPAAPTASEIVATLYQTIMAESYAADGSAPTLPQAMYMIQQMLTEFVITGTTITMKKIDGSTTAATFTLDSATNPTSLTRAT